MLGLGLQMSISNTLIDCSSLSIKVVAEDITNSTTFSRGVLRICFSVFNGISNSRKLSWMSILLKQIVKIHWITERITRQIKSVIMIGSSMAIVTFVYASCSCFLFMNWTYPWYNMLLAIAFEYCTQGFIINITPLAYFFESTKQSVHHLGYFPAPNACSQLHHHDVGYELWPITLSTFEHRTDRTRTTIWVIFYKNSMPCVHLDYLKN